VRCRSRGRWRCEEKRVCQICCRPLVSGCLMKL
jgi:hypothetical protein